MAGPSIVGRESELAELEELAGPGRFVTLVGPGGVGKTTLAAELAARLRPARRTVFVDLAAVDTTDGVEPAIATALGQQRFAGISSAAYADEALIVVDNCEHLLDAAASAIDELRRRLPDVAVHATSRVPLGLRDETVFAIPPLDVPPRHLVDVDAPAVELFLAVAERSGGAVPESDLGGVCELCRRVDGVPLAIEIVATRTRSMAVGEILERLGDRLDTIGQGGFRRDRRQRSVRDTVEWSYHLLDPPAQQLFNRLGVHPGRFDPTMAHALSGHQSTDETFDLLDQLVATSLLGADRGVDGTTWYRQLDAVRACALDHLTAAGEVDSTTERLVDHVVAQATALADHAKRGWTAETFLMISNLLDGALPALRWVIEHDQSPNRAFDLMTVLWGHQSRTDEVLATATEALGRWSDVEEPRWADAASTVATCLWITGRFDDADALVERALPVEDRAVFAPVLLRRVRGQIRREQQRFDEAIEWLTAAGAEAERLGLAALSADADLLRAALLTSMGEVDAALEIAGAVRDRADVASMVEVLALSIESDALLQTDPAAAVESAQRGIDLASGTWYAAATVGFGRTIALGRALDGDLPGAASALARGVELMTATGSLAPARAVLEAAAVIAQRAGRSEWADLLRAAEATTAVQMVASAVRWLPAPPPTSGPPPNLSRALVLVDNLVADLAQAEPSDAVQVEPADRSQAGTVESERPANRWERRGDHWEITYDGRSVTVRHAKGIDDLAALLASPETEVSALDLTGASVVQADTGDVIDADARRQYEARIRELQGELAEAEDDNDIGRVELLTSELDILVDHLSEAVGLGRRTRKTGATTERARTAVTRRIRKAIARLDDLHPALGRHLDGSVRTGTFCEYRPERPTEWHIDR